MGYTTRKSIKRKLVRIGVELEKLILKCGEIAMWYEFREGNIPEGFRLLTVGLEEMRVLVNRLENEI